VNQLLKICQTSDVDEILKHHVRLDVDVDEVLMVHPRLDVDGLLQLHHASSVD